MPDILRLMSAEPDVIIYEVFDVAGAPHQLTVKVWPAGFEATLVNLTSGRACHRASEPSPASARR